MNLPLDIQQDMFEMLRIDLRDVNDANYRLWQSLERAFVDKLTFKQFRAMQGLTSYTARYKYARRISRSKALREISLRAERAFQVWQQSKRAYTAHLELDPSRKSEVLTHEF